MSEDFTQDEAKAFLGKMFECLVGLPGIPNGTHGRAVAAEKIGDHWDVVIEWDLPARRIGKRSPRDRLAKSVIQKFMQEVKP